MTDPERLLGHGTDLEARLLSSALDEPPPPALLARTLETVGAAVLSPPAAAAAAKAGAMAAVKTTGGGILGAIGIGVLAGVLTVGVLSLPPTRPTPNPLPARTASSAATSSPATPDVLSPPPDPPGPPVEPASPPSVPSTVPAASGSRPSTLAAEFALLDEATRALQDEDPARARALLDRYRRELPHGQMAREASLLRGKVDAALEAGLDAAKTNP